MVNVIPFNYADIFLLQDNTILLRLELLKINLLLKNKQFFFSFLAYKTLRAIVTKFFSFFPNHLFLMENVFLPSYIYL